VDVQLDAPLKVARWRPIVHWLLAIPHLIVLYVLDFVQFVAWVIAWFAILFTGNMPESLFNLITMVIRYQWRVTTYMAFMREPYPPFDFSLTAEDDGLDTPTRLSAQHPDGLSRWRIFVKWLLAIPHLIILWFLGVASFVVLVIGFFAVIITGTWPEGLRRFYVGASRWSYRVTAYLYLLTDQYPPFSLD
jgi:hypothetical protein